MFFFILVGLYATSSFFCLFGCLVVEIKVKERATSFVCIIFTRLTREPQTGSEREKQKSSVKNILTEFNTKTFSFFFEENF